MKPVNPSATHVRVYNPETEILTEWWGDFPGREEMMKTPSKGIDLTGVCTCGSDIHNPDCHILDRPSTGFVMEYYRRKLMETLTQPLILPPRSRKPRPWWVRLWHTIHYRTIGRFQDWLHRDCGDC